MLATSMRIRQIREVEVAGLGERIRQARLAISGVKSLEQICDEVGVSRTYWYDVEKETLKKMRIAKTKALYSGVPAGGALVIPCT